MNATLYFSILTAEGEPPHPFDPFPGAVQPFAAVVLVVLIVLLVWWLLRLQVGQVEPVEVGHGHADETHHQMTAHVPAAVVEVAVEPAPEAVAEPGDAAEAASQAIEVVEVVAEPGDAVEATSEAEPIAELVDEPAAETPPPADDLKKIEGIGPKVEVVMNAAGIATFSQLAEAGAARLQEILAAAEYAYMDPASWPEQARLAAAGDWEGFQKLQGDLKAGRSA